MARKRTRLAKPRKRVAGKANPIAPAPPKGAARVFSEALHTHHRGDVKTALRGYARVLRMDPGFANAYANMGVALRVLGRYGAAIACYRRALALGPETAGIHSNLGNALRDLDRLDEALEAHQRAVELDPAAPDAHYNLGLVLRDRGRFDDALAALDVAISLRANFADYRWDRALTLLQMGDLERGFREYEWRWKLKDAPPRRFDQPVWDGSDLNGRTIMLCQEQGMSDIIQFSRFAAMVKDRGGTVILEAPPGLVRLLSTVPGIDKVVAPGTPVPRFDIQIPLLSLPRIFQTTLETVPDRVPYLTAPELHNLHLPRPVASSLAVGIVWAGSPTQANDRRRSCPMDRFLGLMGLAEVAFYSLQKGEAAKQLRFSGASALVTDLGGRLDDFADTAAVIDQLDLVITVDTAVAHLAGALGRPVWMLLSYTGDWRCPAGREDNPWYPTMRLFQQDRPGDWDGVMERVVAALKDFPTLS